MDQRRTVMRNFGLGLVLASPVAAFVSFAVFSIVFGEERFEGADEHIDALAHKYLGQERSRGTRPTPCASRTWSRPRAWWLTRRHSAPGISLLRTRSLYAT